MIDFDICIACGNTSDILLGDGKGNVECLCQECHNEAMVDFLDSATADDKLIGHIRCGRNTDECIIYFGENDCSWEALGRYVSTYEGFNIKIEFGNFEDECDDVDLSP
jgi:hypothetical protein